LNKETSFLLHKRGDLPLDIDKKYDKKSSLFIIKSSHIVLINKNNNYEIGIPVSFYILDSCYDNHYFFINVLINNAIMTEDLCNIIFFKRQ